MAVAVDLAPLKYLAGLAHAISKAGGHFYAETIVEVVKEDENNVEITAATGHVVRARHAVVATNAPINDRYAIHSKQAPTAPMPWRSRYRRRPCRMDSTGTLLKPTTTFVCSRELASPTS